MTDPAELATSMNDGIAWNQRQEALFRDAMQAFAEKSALSNETGDPKRATAELQHALWCGTIADEYSARSEQLQHIRDRLMHYMNTDNPRIMDAIREYENGSAA